VKMHQCLDTLFYMKEKDAMRENAQLQRVAWIRQRQVESIVSV
jgi:hypothetical protein